MPSLQACVDDSRSSARHGSPIFMLAALLSTHDGWAALKSEWQAKLDQPPSLQYFKLSQALSLRGEFDESKGWTAALRDERLREFAAIARKYALCGISCYMPERLYGEFVKSFTQHKELRDPYFLCFYQMADAITSARDFFPPTSGLDYIFDEHGEIGKRAVQWWDRLKAAASWRDAEHLGSTPIHKDDKAFLPLQAADLYAGLRRKRIEAGQDTTRMLSPSREALAMFESMAAWDRTWEKPDLEEITASLVIQNAARVERRGRPRS